jgi:hypothetical protein
MLLLNANISKCNQKLKEINFDSPFQSHCTDKEIAEYIIQHSIAKGFDESELITFINKYWKRSKTAFNIKLRDLLTEKNKTSSEKQTKHEKGEHVINRGVISVYQDIINIFTVDHFCYIDASRSCYTSYD